jgi:hypothetical protein
VRTLRILLPAPPDPAREDAWALVDGNGRVVERGRGAPSTWPAADRREAVIAAEAVRIASLSLPPLPASRVAAAAAYALEDRLATPADQVAIAVGERRDDGRIVATVIARDLALALQRVVPPFSRAIAEPALAVADDGWHWCESEDSAFVRTDDGGGFAVSRSLNGALPVELAHALGQAARAGRSPAEVVADRASDEASLAAWTRESGVPFRAGTPWRWESAPAAASASACDLLQAVRRAPDSAQSSKRTHYSAAIGMVLAALGVHIVATLGTWAWQELQLSRMANALVPIARQAGAADATVANASSQIARLHADARHRAGLAAPLDAMPMLARAAPALASLPAGALKTATWSGGAWTLELTALDEATLARIAARLAEAGIGMLHAQTASGVRARLSMAS